MRRWGSSPVAPACSVPASANTLPKRARKSCVWVALIFAATHKHDFRALVGKVFADAGTEHAGATGDDHHLLIH